MLGTQNNHNNLKKEQTWRTHISLLKTYYKDSVIKKVWYWHKDKEFISRIQLRVQK